MMEAFVTGRPHPAAASPQVTELHLKALLSAAMDLCLLRLGPQHMPVSSTLFALLLLLNLLLGTLMVMAARIGLAMGLLESLFELAVMLGILYAALRMSRKLKRFSQTAIALLLSGLLLNLLALPLVSWNQRTASAESGLLVLVLIFWSIVVLGHIIRHAFDVELNLGIAAAVLYTLVTWNITALLFPVPS